ncbi:hypothetical protein [Polynucleobacter kasalickyi]|uniref:hypothetical protein n=1 Tax=Polynucleobacter kasalickyi TaxID=1938817 RepID=UPI00117D9968|nr:hypothetical protein [Polynucleobacter kasalickyi]
MAFTDFTLFSILFVVTGIFALATFALAISLTGVLLFALGAALAMEAVALFAVDLTTGFLTGLTADLGTDLATGLGASLVTDFITDFVADLAVGLVTAFAKVLAGTFATMAFALTLVSTFFIGFFSATFLVADCFDNTFFDGVFLTGIVFGIFALDVKK